MREIKLPFGKAADGRMVSVDAVVRGLDCDCVCPSCGADLVAAKGEIYQHHFRHYTDRADCIAARETAIHQFAKQIILEKLQLALPDPLGVMVKATAECRLGDIIPDVLAEYDSGETLAVEIWVAHQVPVHKVRTYNQLRQAAVEIDLRAYRLTEKSESEWEAAILFDADRSWLSPPDHIRQERERQRRLWLVAQLKRFKMRAEQMREAERERAAAAATLKAAMEVEAGERAARAELDRLEWELEKAQLRAQREQDAADRERRRLKVAQERAKEAEFRRVAHARLRLEMRPPDLQAMVRAHGGWDRITPEAWEAFVHEMRIWRSRVVTGEFHRPPYSEVPPEDDWRTTGAELAHERRSTDQHTDGGLAPLAPVAPVGVSPFGGKPSTDAASGATSEGQNLHPV